MIYFIYMGETGEYVEISTLGTFLSILRILGLQGSYMVYLCRMWLFHWVYAMDHAILSRNTNSKFIRYQGTFGNERFMLGFVFSIFFILFVIVILDEVDVVEIPFATQIYFLILTISFLCLAAHIIPQKHDQLGLKLEFVLLVVLCIVGFIGLVVLQVIVDEIDQKRIMSYLGGVCVLFLGNFISFYITMIHYNGYKHIMKNEKTTANSSDVHLATLLLDRTFDTYRSFLAEILCVENLDFVVIVQQYRNLVLSKCKGNDDLPSPRGSSSMPSSPSFRLSKSASQKQIISNLLVLHPQTQRHVIDITKMDFDFVPLPQELLERAGADEGSAKSWFMFIYEKYVHKDGECSLNLPWEMRSSYARDYQQLLESNALNDEQFEPDTTTLLSSFFDQAQYEVWQLMSADSMMHFATSPLMKQCLWESDPKEEISL